MEEVLAALEQQKAELEREILALQAKLHRVILALDALKAGDLFDGLRKPTNRVRAPGTLKEMAFTVLYEARTPLTAQEVLTAIDQKFGQEIERTSMSPQLSRLGQDGILLRNGNRWLLNPNRPIEADKHYLIRETDDLI